MQKTRGFLEAFKRDAYFGMVLQNFFLYSIATTLPHLELHKKQSMLRIKSKSRAASNPDPMSGSTEPNPNRTYSPLWTCFRALSNYSAHEANFRYDGAHGAVFGGQFARQSVILAVSWLAVSLRRSVVRVRPPLPRFFRSLKVCFA